jgi:hypothetical protein
MEAFDSSESDDVSVETAFRNLWTKNPSEMAKSIARVNCVVSVGVRGVWNGDSIFARYVVLEENRARTPPIILTTKMSERQATTKVNIDPKDEYPSFEIFDSEVNSALRSFHFEGSKLKKIGIRKLLGQAAFSSKKR